MIFGGSASFGSLVLLRRSACTVFRFIYIVLLRNRLWLVVVPSQRHQHATLQPAAPMTRVRIRRCFSFLACVSFIGFDSLITLQRAKNAVGSVYPSELR